MLDYEAKAAGTDIRFERIADVLTIKMPREGFVRFAGHRVRSPHFLLYSGVFLLVLFWQDIWDWLWRAVHGQLAVWPFTSGLVGWFLLPPAFAIGFYLVTVSQTSVTIRLYRRELVFSTDEPFQSIRETSIERQDIAGLRVGATTLSLTLHRRLVFGLPRRTILTSGRTREERERVAAAIRDWLERTAPGGLG
jgi:hypothetical protein